MFKTLALVTLSVVTLAQYGSGLGGGLNTRDLRTVNTINEIENRKILRVDNALDRNVGNVKNHLKNELTGIITQGTNLQTRNVLNGNRFGYY